MTVHERIKQRREEIKMSAIALAKMLGLTKANIYSWEGGRTAPKRGRLKEVADALLTTPEWLLFGDEQPPDQQIVSQLAMRMAVEFDKLSAESKLIVMENIFQQKAAK